jgi:hypothetical protein
VDVTQASPANAVEPPARRWERWAHASHSYVLPTAAAAGIALGGALAVGAPRVLEAYAPAALILLGVGTLGSSLAFLRWRRHVSLEVAAEESAVGAAATACPRCAAESEEHREWTDLVRRAWHTPIAAAPASGPRPIPLGVRAGDQIWHAWATEPAGTLPVPLVGPVPETAWVPPKPGSYIPFAAKEPRLIVVDGSLAPILMGGAIPNEAVTSSVFSAAPAGPAAASAVSSVVDLGSRTSDLGPTFDFGPSGGPLDWILQEALHPLPPHLRPAPPTTWTSSESSAPVEHPHPVSSLMDLGETCGTCTRTLPEDEGWGLCPECGIPVCHDCRARAVVEFGHTWCAGCGVSRAWELPFPGAPAMNGVNPPTSA